MSDRCGKADKAKFRASERSKICGDIYKRWSEMSVDKTHRSNQEWPPGPVRGIQAMRLHIFQDTNLGLFVNRLSKYTL
jgi:hypothetical protein